MKQIFVDVKRCNGCLTCVLACAAEHSSTGDIVGAMLENVEPRLTVEAVNGQAVPLMCRHCQEPACVDACMTGAMQKDPVTGIVTNEGNEQTCVGCWMCVMACPYGLVWPRKSDQQIALKCDRCKGTDIPACVASCPNDALFFVEGSEFAGNRMAQVAKSLVEGLVQVG